MTRRVGMTLGKFAPLHRGHQHVIETALAEMDEVIVVIYDAPETTSIPLPVRAGWIRSLYPTVEVIEAWGGPTEVGDTPEIKRMHEEYLLALLRDRAITHFYSSEFYGDHVSRAFGAVNRLVDPDRTVVPVSGTAVRQSPYQHRQFVDPVVYRDLVTNVVFLGAPSTGKSTLTERMAAEYNTVWMPEYGREYWETHQVNRRLTPHQLLEIAEGHLEREDKLLLEALARQAETRYDLVFLCGDDIPYDDTWDRSGDVQRKIFQRQIMADLIRRKVPFILLTGTLEERVAKVKNVLSHFRKYEPWPAPLACSM